MQNLRLDISTIDLHQKAAEQLIAFAEAETYFYLMRQWVPEKQRLSNQYVRI